MMLNIQNFYQKKKNRVKFEEKIEINEICICNVCKEARCGYWVLDALRFKTKIENFEKIFKKCFKLE